MFEYTESKSVSLITKTFISRLIKIECPEEILLELLGRSKKHRIYNRQISLDIKKLVRAIRNITFSTKSVKYSSCADFVLIINDRVITIYGISLTWIRQALLL